jgi:hypothetical protein
MRRHLITLCSALALSACSQTSTTTSVDDTALNTAATYIPATKTTRITGYVFDPEAFIWSLQNDMFGGPPQFSLTAPHLLRSLVQNASASIQDENGNTLASAVNGTDAYGVFTAEVPTGSATTFLASSNAAAGVLSSPDSPSYQGFPYDPIDPPLPPGNYLPTTLLRRIDAQNRYCYVPTVPAISDAGILQAVAKYLTNDLAQPTAVSDLLDSSKYGGVIIWSAQTPTLWDFFNPGFGVGSTASVGDTYNITWAPPGSPDLSPEELVDQSDRGFLVADPTDPFSFLGITVTLLPPSSSPTSVTISTQDFDDGDPGRPYNYQDMTYSVSPGVVSFGFEIADLPPNRTVDTPFGPVYIPLPQEYRCIVDANQDI